MCFWSYSTYISLNFRIIIFIDATRRSINGRWYGGLGLFSIPLFEYTLRTVMAAGADVARRTQKVGDETTQDPWWVKQVLGGGGRTSAELQRMPGGKWNRLPVGETRKMDSDVTQYTSSPEGRWWNDDPWWVKICIQFFYIHSLHIDSDHISASICTHGTRLVKQETWSRSEMKTKISKTAKKW